MFERPSSSWPDAKNDIWRTKSDRFCTKVFTAYTTLRLHTCLRRFILIGAVVSFDYSQLFYTTEHVGLSHYNGCIMTPGLIMRSLIKHSARLLGNRRLITGRPFMESIINSCHHATVWENTQCLRKYRQISNIRRIQSQNLHVSRFGLQLSLPNPLKVIVKWRLKLSLEQYRQAMLQLHLSDQQFHNPLRCGLY